MAQHITTLLAQWKAGSEDAGRLVMEQIYDQVRAIAAHQLKAERPDHTLQPTALAHEVYVRVMEEGPVPAAEGQRHLMALIARQVRQVLVQYARRRARPKHGGDVVQVVLDEMNAPAPTSTAVLALEAALTALGQQDAVALKVVELRFFGGLTETQVSEELEIGTATVSRKWKFARSWLHGELFS